MLRPKTVPEQFKSILLATDLSPASFKPLRHAVSLARHFQSKLNIAYIVSSLGFTINGPDALALAVEATARDMENLKRRLEASGVTHGVDCRFLVCSGCVMTQVEQIVQREKIDLVVAGVHNRETIERIMIGSTAEKISINSSCPVLIVGPNATPDWSDPAEDKRRPLLLATAFEKSSDRALTYGVSLAHRMNRRLTLLQVMKKEKPEGAGESGLTTPETPQVLMKRLVLGRLRAVGLEYPSFEEAIECRMEYGDPAASILRTAQQSDAEAVIIGLNHNTYIEAVTHFPWSMAHRVIRGAPCPILAISQ